MPSTFLTKDKNVLSALLDLNEPHRIALLSLPLQDPPKETRLNQATLHVESAHAFFYTDNVSARAHAAKSLEIRTEILGRGDLDTCFPMAMIAYCTRNSRGILAVLIYSRKVLDWWRRGA